MRRSDWRYYLGGVAAALGLDLLYALLATFASASWTRTSLLQIAFYAALGWFVARRTRSGRTGTSVAFVTAIFDASLGTWIYESIVPKKPFAGNIATLVIASVMTVVVLTAIGGISAALTSRRRARRP